MIASKRIKLKTIRRTAGSVLTFVSAILVPVYTLIFGTKEDPFVNTLSRTGNAFDHKTEFLIWGFITTLLLCYLTLEVFAQANYSGNNAKMMLYASQMCFILSVLTPALNDVFPVWHAVHVVLSSSYVILFSVSILLFIKHLSKIDVALAEKSLYLFLACIGTPAASLLLFGLNSAVQILYFACISVLLVVMRAYLLSAQAARSSIDIIIYRSADRETELRYEENTRN